MVHDQSRHLFGHWTDISGTTAVELVLLKLAVELLLAPVLMQTGMR